MYGSWSNSFTQYNCYGYAVGYYDLINPGHIAWMNEGHDYDDYVYNATAKLAFIATWVKNDLESLGYSVEFPTTTRPDMTVTAHTHLICLRRAENLSHDFHFMKLGQDGDWYHKPGQTNPLKYKYVPSNSRVWICEGYDGVDDVYFYDSSYLYDSTIFYIEYTTPHEWEYVYCGSGQHINTCTICEETTGAAISCTYLNDVCRICGVYNGEGYLPVG